MQPFRTLLGLFGRSKSARSHLNPVAHPLTPFFDATHYMAQLTAEQAAHARPAPLKHYLATGWREGRNPHRFFDIAWYLAQNPDVATKGIEPFGHYVSIGWTEGREPHPDFNSNEYLSKHPELLVTHACPLILLAHCYQPAISPRTTPYPEPPPARHWPSHYHHGRPYPYLEPEVMKERAATYRKTKGRSNKIAFFTCITGGYDTLRLPEVLSPDIDYILFTDRPANGYGVFEVRLIQLEEHDPARASRHAKLQPHHYLDGYEFVVSFDANVMLREDFHPHLARFANSGLSLAFLPNTIFNCLYKDAVSCAQSGRDKPEKIVPQMLAYQREGFPADYGLIEGNLFAARLQRPEVRAFFDAWWSELSRGSRRDQLSANYVLWKLGLKYFPFLGEGQNTRTHPGVALLKHGTYDASRFAVLANNGHPS
jgi:hypothetical protein